jgi:glyoxylase-like metal-dependent hydrolase (beta-lactamase superfamily II)
MRKIVFGFMAAAMAFANDGVFRFAVGDLEIIAVSDKNTNMGKSIMLNPDAPIVKKLLADDQNPSSINAFLVRGKAESQGGKYATVLIDSGVGGDLFANLKRIGIEPEHIDIAIVTHMHGDHIGGLTKDGAATLKYAKVLLPKNDLDYWLGSGEENGKRARELKNAYGDRLSTFEWDARVSLGIAAIKAEGHTPGHSAFLVESNGEKLLIVGDLIHSLKVQTADPSQSVIYDVDPELAASTRRKILNYAANGGITIAGMHILFPGVGKIAKEGEGFKFTPIE